MEAKFSKENCTIHPRPQCRLSFFSDSLWIHQWNRSLCTCPLSPCRFPVGSALCVCDRILGLLWRRPRSQHVDYLDWIPRFLSKWIRHQSFRFRCRVKAYSHHAIFFWLRLRFFPKTQMQSLTKVFIYNIAHKNPPQLHVVNTSIDSHNAFSVIKRMQSQSENKNAFQSKAYHLRNTYITKTFTIDKIVDMTFKWPWPSGDLDLQACFSGIQAYVCKS